MQNLRRVAILGLAALGVGCQNSLMQPKTKTAFDRDPLVMAHLTHTKDDPAFRETETDIARMDETQLQPASGQSKSNKPRSADGPSSYSAPPRSRSANYEWVRGVVSSSRDDGEPVWFVDYSRSSKDKFGGRLRLDPSPRLGLLREGDPVHLTGRVVADDPLEPRYEVGDIVLLR